MEDNDKIACSACSTEVDSDEIRQYSNGDYVCDECSRYCDECSSLVPADDTVIANDGEYIVCEDCYWSCDNCSDYYTSSTDDYTVNGRYGLVMFCRGCYEDNTFYCDGCSESYSDDVDNAYIRSIGEHRCQQCLNDYWTWCDDCDEYHDSDSDECSDGQVRCRCGRVTVHSYGCKPEPIFYGTDKHGVFMGFELEMEIRNRDSSAYKEASSFASDILYPNTAILKEDASIGRGGYYGFELVTHPRTHLDYRTNAQHLWDTIETLRTKYDARSWDTDTCGLHVHVSRKGFTSGAHTHRWINFIYSNAEQMMKLAGRKSTYARFNDVYTFDEYDQPVRSFAHKVGDPARYSTERYSAVNTQNKHTLELRFFRGTMSRSGVLSALDLVQASVEYTRTLTLSDVKMGALSWEWFADYVEQNNGLYPDLYSRLPKISSININNREMLNA